MNLTPSNPYFIVENKVNLYFGAKPIFHLRGGPGWVWFRFFNKWGLSAKNHTLPGLGLLYSQRVKPKGLTIGRYFIAILH